MQQAQETPEFPSLFEIRAAVVESEVAMTRCEFCEHYDWPRFEIDWAARISLCWTRDERLQPGLDYQRLYRPL